MAKQRNDYFQLILNQVAYCVKAADLLETLLAGYEAASLEERRAAMHRIEQEADEVYHDILNRLSVEFITPIDREDILHLVQIIDDVTDALDEVVLECYMFHVQTLPAQVSALAAAAGRCVRALETALTELKNFKKPENLRRLLVEVNTIEGEADGLYTEAIYRLFETESDGKKLISGKALYDSLENCCDLCEHAANVVDQIIIKNT